MRLTKEQNKIIDQYIIDHINFNEYTDKELKTDKEKLNFVFNDAFVPEKWNWEKSRGTNIQVALADWIAGLPTGFTIAFTNYDIINLTKEWGSIPINASEREESKIIENWFNFVAARLLKLANRYKVDIKIN